MLNVDGSDDPSYRYKMPKLLSKVEGRGNGVKTVLVNCIDVAQALRRSPQQVTKFFGCEMGAMTNHESDKYLVNGAFDNKILQDALTGYIQKFVLCPSCGNPETVEEMKGKKKSAMIMLNCKACGALSPADNTHKLVTFIIKEMSSETGSSQNKKKERKEKRNEKNKKSGSGVDDASDSADENKEKEKKKKKKEGKEKVDKDSKEKEKKKKKKREKGRSSESKSSGSETEDAVLPKALGNLRDELGALTVSDVAALNNSVEKVLEQVLANSSDTKVLESVVEQQTSAGLRRADRIPILFFSILHPKISLSVLVQRLPLLAKIVEPVRDVFLGDDEVQIEILLCLEEALTRASEGSPRDELRKFLPVVLKSAYDEDLLGEAMILDWYEGKLPKEKYKHLRISVDKEELAKMKKVAEPIIAWLKEADSDSESEDDDDEENE